jgi:hypothetical protein
MHEGMPLPLLPPTNDKINKINKFSSERKYVNFQTR